MLVNGTPSQQRSHLVDTIMEYTAANICNGEYGDIKAFRELLLWRLVEMTDDEVYHLFDNNGWAHPFVERWWKIFIEQQKRLINLA